jgi:hypothetical protein
MQKQVLSTPDVSGDENARKSGDRNVFLRSGNIRATVSC